MKRIKIAQMGIMCAHSRQHLRSILEQSGIYEFMGLWPACDVDYAYFSPENAREAIASAQKQFGKFPILTKEELLAIPGLEAVAVETTEADLVRTALEAAEHGLHIFMDKPGGESAEDFHKLTALQRKYGKVLELGYMYRYNPSVIDLYDRIARGELGEILSVEAHMDCDHNPEIRCWLGNFKGGIMYFLGCHLVDIVCHIQGIPRRVLNLNAASRLNGVNSVDYGMTVFEYPHGPSFIKTSATEFGGFMRRQLVVSGTKGEVEIKPLEYYDDPHSTKIKTDMRLVTREAEGNRGWNASGKTKTFGPVDRYDTMLAEFAACCRGDKINPYTPDYEDGFFDLLMECCGVGRQPKTEGI